MVAQRDKQTTQTRPARPRFEVVRAFGAYAPGEVIEAGDDWPFYRAKQLQEQRFLRPLDQEPDAPRRNG